MSGTNWGAVGGGAVSGAEAGSAFGPEGTVIGGLIGGAAGFLSGGGSQNAPAYVPYQPVDLQQTQQQALLGDQGASATLDQLLGQSNTFQQQQATSLMNQALPGYSGFAQNLTNTASSLAANPYQVPQSVVGQLSQYAAENNISEGTGAASGFSSSNLLRSLGVNALQYGQANMASATNALQTLSNTAPRVSPMSPLSFMVTPQQQAQNQQYTNTLQAQGGQASANAQAAAANYNSSNLWDQTTGALNQSSYLTSLISGGNGSITANGASQTNAGSAAGSGNGLF